MDEDNHQLCEAWENMDLGSAIDITVTPAPDACVPCRLRP